MHPLPAQKPACLLSLLVPTLCAGVLKASAVSEWKHSSQTEGYVGITGEGALGRSAAAGEVVDMLSSFQGAARACAGRG